MVRMRRNKSSFFPLRNREKGEIAPYEKKLAISDGLIWARFHTFDVFFAFPGDVSAIVARLFQISDSKSAILRRLRPKLRPKLTLIRGRAPVSQKPDVCAAWIFILSETYQ